MQTNCCHKQTTDKALKVNADLTQNVAFISEEEN